MQKVIITRTVVMNRPDSPVVLNKKRKKNSYAEVNVSKGKESRVSSCSRAPRVDTSMIHTGALQFLSGVHGYVQPN